jgi:GNAT superfamily N-acetyltransferase
MKPAEDIILRPPDPGDAKAIAGLLAELGYPATEAEAETQLAGVRAIPNSLVLVAAAGPEVVGLITSHIFASVHSRTPVAWITTLVVSPDAQGKGVGTMLLHEAERWAVENGVERISLTSGVHRSEAHDFYRRKGYDNSGLRFTKVF